MHFIRLSLVFAVAVVALPVGSFAQRTIQPFTVELSGGVGGTFDFPGATAYSGICQANSTNCNQQLHLGTKSFPTFGGEVAVSLTRFLWLYGDYDYMLPDRASASSSIGTSTQNTTASRHYWTATGGVEVSFPQVHRIVPLLRFGGGEVYNNYNFYSLGVNVTPSTLEHYDAQGIKSGTIGGGVRWYLGERQGIRIMMNGFYLGHSIEEAAAPAPGFGGVAFVSRRSGGAVTIAYFYQFGH